MVTGTTATDGAGRWAAEVPPWSIDRPALRARLDGTSPGTAVFLAAPAGFGKTILAVQWAATRRERVTWVPLAGAVDEEGVRAAVAAGLAAALAPTSAAPSTDSWRPAALRACLAGAPDALLVLDGLRAPTRLAVVAELARALAEADGCGMRLVVTSRCRAPAALAPLVVRGRALLLAEEDLAFSEEEAHEVLSRVAGGDVSEQARRALVRLEGWPAAVVAVAHALSRRSLRGSSSAASGLEVVHDYLMSEVLRDEGAEVRGLLSDLALLDAVTGDLCDAVTGQTGGAQLLAGFRERGGPLLPALPTTRSASAGTPWFRLHPLLRSTLVARVPEREPGRRAAVAELAAAWLRDRGEPLGAARLLAALARWDEVEGILQAHVVGELLASGRAAEMAEVLATAPGDVLARNERWLMGLATLEMIGGNWTRTLELLAVGERWLGTAAQMTGNLLRCKTGFFVRDPRPTLAWGARALEQCDEIGDDYQFGDLYNRSRTEHYRVIGHGHLTSLAALAGDWTTANRHRWEPVPEVLAEMPVSAVVQAVGEQALARVLAGEVEIAASLVHLATEGGVDGDAFTELQAAPAHLAAGEVARAGGRPAEAILALEAARSRSASNHRQLLEAAAVAALALARLDQGDAGASAVLDGWRAADYASARTVGGMLAAAEARLRSTHGDHRGAVAVLQATSLSSVSALTAVDLALRAHDRALLAGIIEDWPTEPTVADRVRRALASAAAHLAAGRRQPASQQLDRALPLAARHGLVQPVAELAEHLAPLLRAAARGRSRSVAALCQQVLGAVPDPVLPVRHQAILRLLAEGRTLQDVAEELHVSVNTVKKHVRLIYRSLGVHNRADAVAAWSDQGAR